LCRYDVQRRSACGNQSGLIVKIISGCCGKLFGFSLGITFHFQPGILFTIAPERFSRSPRNRVHLAPESAVCADLRRHRPHKVTTSLDKLRRFFQRLVDTSGLLGHNVGFRIVDEAKSRRKDYTRLREWRSRCGRRRAKTRRRRILRCSSWGMPRQNQSTAHGGIARIDAPHLVGKDVDTQSP
jgi:hypothetical protein